MPFKDKTVRNEYMRKRRASSKLNDAMWSGIRVWYPPFHKEGRYYRTKYKKTEYKEENGNLVGVVTMELIPEEEVKTK